MYHKQIISILLGMLAGSSLMAREGAEVLANPCTVEPVFHCVETRGDGGAIGHFGYRASCPASDKPVEEVHVPIGDDNYFAPGAIDRGQPTVFVLGDHVDEFDSEFSAEEVKKGSGWTIMKIGIKVDFTRTKDASLDCKNLPY